MDKKTGLPALSRVPSIHEHPLVLRISHTGATLLKGGSFKKRFTGGEAVVDINGGLHLSRRAYKEALKKEENSREQHKANLGFIKKKARVKKVEPVPVEIEQKSDTVPEKKNKGYVVNKTEVTNRIESMTNAIFSNTKTGAFMGMLTVTFPPCVTEVIAMQALNTWLTALRQKGKRVIREYLWISERQDGKRLKDQGKATNTIHYHMLILNRMNIVYVNRAMHVVLCNMIRAGVIDYPLTAMKRYNGVDLAKDRKTRVVTNFCDPKARKTLSHYITKYVTKNNESFAHSAWGCSRGFSAIFTAITCTYQEFIKMQWCEVAWQDPAIITEWFDFFPWLSDPPNDFVKYLASVNKFILEQRGFLN
jgi:hypothetical protein